MRKCGILKLGVVLVGALLFCTGCSTSSRVSSEGNSMVATCPNCGPTPPGVTEFVWEEPMVDVIDVPPGLDPEGHYYRPAHQEIVEIRQGRWKYYKAP